MPNSCYSKWLKEHMHGSYLKKTSQCSEQVKYRAWPSKSSVERGQLVGQVCLNRFVGDRVLNVTVYGLPLR